MPIKIQDNRTFVSAHGNPFFYLADTIWAAFQGAEQDEWEEYLKIRKQQGFNVLQISILPINHDQSLPVRYLPFKRKEDGGFDYSAVNQTYFDRAKSMLEKAKSMGFYICLVLLWRDYVPGNCVSLQDSRFVMTEEERDSYIAYVAELFKGLFEFCFISGDTDFPGNEVIDAYNSSLNRLKGYLPEVLCAMHICGELTELPDKLRENPNLDFYVFQSGHNRASQVKIPDMAQAFVSMRPARPVVNSEPCYEGHGYGNEYGRYEGKDIRYAFWQSMLSGANAGFTYGAHGMWSWHRADSTFTSESWSKMPFSWQDTVSFEGAQQLKWMLEIFETYKISEMHLNNQKICERYDNITFAESESAFAVFIPSPIPVKLKLDITNYKLQILSLQSREIFDVHFTVQDGISEIKMPSFNGDYLILGSL